VTDPRSFVANLCRLQAPYCRALGSPLYERLLYRAADDVEAGGPIWDVLEGHGADPPGSMLQLRLMGAVHRLVLNGEAPVLARFYPSVGGEADLDRAWPAFRELVGEHRKRLAEEINAPVQTNEVGRSMALLGGFLTVAKRTGLPLRALEVGASAGLNLRFDDYLYSDSPTGLSWGPGDSRVRFVDFIAEGRPPLEVRATVADRRGCDANPLDPASELDRLLLTSFVWADQVERFEALRAALELAGRRPVTVEQQDAGEWAERQLRAVRPGLATVIFHSLVIQYLSDATRERLIAAIEAAGRRASEQAPLAWLRMELGGDEADVRLSVWPSGEERLVARAGYHGRPVRWLAD
jgi:hypothetical protein